jgi:hypothetical protein
MLLNAFRESCLFVGLCTMFAGVCVVFVLWYGLVVCRTLRRCGVSRSDALLPKRFLHNLSIYRSIKVAHGEGSLYYVTVMLIWATILSAVALLCCTAFILGTSLQNHGLHSMAFTHW